MLFNPSILKILGQNISHKAIFTTKFPHFSHQSNIHDKIAVISVKIFCEPKYFLVSRIPRYTIISTSGLRYGQTKVARDFIDDVCRIFFVRGGGTKIRTD